MDVGGALRRAGRDDEARSVYREIADDAAAAEEVKHEALMGLAECALAEGVDLDGAVRDFEALSRSSEPQLSLFGRVWRRVAQTFAGWLGIGRFLRDARFVESAERDGHVLVSDLSATAEKIDETTYTSELVRAKGVEILISHEAGKAGDSERRRGVFHLRS